MTVERDDAGAHGPMDAKARAFGDGNYMDNSVVTAARGLGASCHRWRHDSLRVLADTACTGTGAVDCHNQVRR